MARAGMDVSRQHHLSMTTPLPTRKICLTVTHNKLQLISLSSEYIIQQADQLPERKALILTGREPTSSEMLDDRVTVELKTTHEHRTQ